MNKSIKYLNQINKSSTIKGGVLDVLDKSFEKNLQTILKESDFKPDVLINNQGGQSQVFNRFPNLEKDDLLEEFNLNLISVILSIQIFYEELLKSEYPSIINVASIAGMVDEIEKFILQVICLNKELNMHQQKQASLV